MSVFTSCTFAAFSEQQTFSLSHDAPENTLLDDLFFSNILAGMGCTTSLYYALQVESFPCHMASNAYCNDLGSGRLDLGRQNDQTCC